MDQKRDAHMDEVNKKFPGAIKLGSDPSLKIQRIPTGIDSVDYLLDGGLARNRYLELYGSYNVGKTYLTFRALGNAQRLGLGACFADVEGTFDPRFAEKAGIDLRRLRLIQQEDAEQVIDMAEVQIRSGLYDVIGIDSIAALSPRSEVDSSMGDRSMGMEQAKLMSKALRKLTVANTDSAIIFINQTRQAVGASAFAKQTTTSGGRSMAFYAGTRLELNRTENIKAQRKLINPNTGDVIKKASTVGHRVLMRVEKDKTGAAIAGAEGTFVYDYINGGIDATEDLMYLGRRTGLIKKSGSKWWVVGYEEEKQSSRNKFHKWLLRNVAVSDELRTDIFNTAEPDTIIEDKDEDDD